jgi:hypothetical protein
MKLLTTITAIALVMAATGCETTKQKEARGMIRTPYGDWVKKGTPYFGDGTPVKMPPGMVPAFDGTVFTQAMAAQQQAPQPVIVVGPDSGTTIATQSSFGTVVSKFGGDRGLYIPPPIPINTGNQSPTVYTMPIQQP